MSEPLPGRLVQFNPLVGDVAGNAARMRAHWRDASPALWVFPELAVCGYPPEDLLLRDDFLRRAEAACAELARAAGDHWVVFGAPVRDGGKLYNAACVAHQGRLDTRARKRLLPQYDVFDERRYFAPGREAVAADIAGRRVGLLVCEDLWEPAPSAELAAAGAQLLVCLNASPFDADKARRRLQVARARAAETGCAVWYANQVGGQDELVFDGGSFALDARGGLLARAPVFEEAVLEAPDARTAGGCAQELSADAALYRALALGLRDYVDKHRAPGVVVGVSGGVDSALALTLAADALGAGRCSALRLPSRYTSDASNEDAQALCTNLGVEMETVSIEPMFEAALASLGAVGVTGDLVAQNLQARIRGLLLMAHSNHSGRLLLATGNKSELAVGYATLYGDMAGGFAPLKDVFKTRVYDLARHRNRAGAVIPKRVLTRAPTAELRAQQRDADTLPEYAQLDAVLQAYIEADRAAADIAVAGLDAAAVQAVAQRIAQSEHKRRQAPPGVKVTARAFGRDRRYPITSGYRN